MRINGNEFYTLVTTDKASDKVLYVNSYANLGIAKGQRTRVIRGSGKWYDVKLFKCLYSLGCMTAVELDLP